MPISPYLNYYEINRLHLINDPGSRVEVAPATSEAILTERPEATSTLDESTIPSILVSNAVLAKGQDPAAFALTLGDAERTMLAVVEDGVEKITCVV